MLQAVRLLTELARPVDYRRDNSDMDPRQQLQQNNNQQQQQQHHQQVVGPENSILFREIYKNGWLRKTIKTDNKETNRYWVAFCVHDDVEPRLEGFTDQKQATTHSPVWANSLRNIQHLSPTLCATSRHDYEFCINFSDDRVLRLAAPTYSAMLEWVQIITRKLTDMKILKPKENLYSRGPERIATRDPTSPLPPPPLPSGSWTSQSTNDPPSVPSISSTPSSSSSVLSVDQQNSSIFTFEDISLDDRRSRPSQSRLRSLSSSPHVIPTPAPAPTPASSIDEDTSYENIFMASSYPLPTNITEESRTNEVSVPTIQSNVTQEPSTDQYAALIECRSSGTPEPHLPSVSSLSSISASTGISSASSSSSSSSSSSTRTVQRSTPGTTSLASLAGPSSLASSSPGPSSLASLSPGPSLLASTSSSGSSLLVCTSPGPSLLPPASPGPSLIASTSSGASIIVSKSPVTSISSSNPTRQLTLREKQIAQLKREMTHRAGVRLQLGRRDCKDSIAFVDTFGSIWVAGWKCREHPLLYNVLHVGDMVISVAGVVPNSASAIRDILKGITTPRVEVIVRRLPYARAMILTKRTDNEDFGLEVNGNELSGVSGVAINAGLSPLADATDPTATTGSNTTWTITEVNNRPLNMFDSCASDRLKAIGRDISIVVQPTDLIASLRNKLRAMRSYKSFILQ
ncbi:mucin-5AC [Microplitis demolitor]|uniref:mucin-5AC n=1 Tax=Microplitis demolitor TaxID=69319 RepID=UPI0004CD3BDE|nr:mucin-5AC [Microplitis demolitor]